MPPRDGYNRLLGTQKGPGGQLILKYNLPRPCCIGSCLGLAQRVGFQASRHQLLQTPQLQFAVKGIRKPGCFKLGNKSFARPGDPPPILTHRGPRARRASLLVPPAATCVGGLPGRHRPPGGAVRASRSRRAGPAGCVVARAWRGWSAGSLWSREKNAPGGEPGGGQLTSRRRGVSQPHCICIGTRDWSSEQGCVTRKSAMQMTHDATEYFEPGSR